MIVSNKQTLELLKAFWIECEKIMSVVHLIGNILMWVHQSSSWLKITIVAI